MNRAELGDRIRQRREDRCLSQMELARACGVQQQQVSKWEKGRTIPGPQTLPLLAQALDLAPDLFVWVSEVHRRDAGASEHELEDVRSQVGSLTADVKSLRTAVDDLADETSTCFRHVLGLMDRIIGLLERQRDEGLRLGPEQVEPG